MTVLVGVLIIALLLVLAGNYGFRGRREGIALIAAGIVIAIVAVLVTIA